MSKIAASAAAGDPNVGMVFARSIRPATARDPSAATRNARFDTARRSDVQHGVVLAARVHFLATPVPVGASLDEVEMSVAGTAHRNQRL